MKIENNIGLLLIHWQNQLSNVKSEIKPALNYLFCIGTSYNWKKNPLLDWVCFFYNIHADSDINLYALKKPINTQIKYIIIFKKNIFLIYTNKYRSMYPVNVPHEFRIIHVVESLSLTQLVWLNSLKVLLWIPLQKPFRGKKTSQKHFGEKKWLKKSLI